MGLALALPPALSPADSPRNAMLGVLLLALAGVAAIERWTTTHAPRPHAIAAPVLLLAALATYSTGTLWNSVAPTKWPSTSIASTLRLQTRGWRQLFFAPPEPDELLFCVDYAVAGAVRYYLGYSAYSAWPQYRLWGMPDLPDAMVLALDYADPALVTQRLRSAFASVEGPVELEMGRGSGGARLYMWRATDRRLDLRAFLEMLDGRSLWGMGPSPDPDAP